MIQSQVSLIGSHAGGGVLHCTIAHAGRVGAIKVDAGPGSGSGSESDGKAGTAVGGQLAVDLDFVSGIDAHRGSG